MRRYNPKINIEVFTDVITSILIHSFPHYFFELISRRNRDVIVIVTEYYLHCESLPPQNIKRRYYLHLRISHRLQFGLIKSRKLKKLQGIVTASGMVLIASSVTI
jgi:hypothetical protein